MTDRPAPNARAGLLYGLAAHGSWGFMPLYFNAIGEIAPLELLAQRIVWCFVVMVIVMTILRGWPELWRRVRTGPTFWLLVASGLLVGFNWYIYIYAVQSERVIQAS